MVSKDIAYKVENIGKIYRIGKKEKVHDNLVRSMFEFIKSPLNNYRKYRSLYKFDNSITDSNYNPSDLIWAVKDVSFEVTKGELVGIIGKNGAGKSTLLKILCRIVVPTCGRAEIHGRVSSLLEVGTGFHQELTGRENVYLNGTILGMRKKEVDQKFDQIVNFSGVDKFIDTPVKRYSSGMKVRLAFSVAAHLEPEILIVDEVLAVGDADFQRKCLKKMEAVGQKGRTVIFVSHNMSAISRLCERVILLDSGKIAMDGPTEDVVSEYLKSSYDVPGELKFDLIENAPGNDVVRLKSVCVKNADGELSPAVNIQQPFFIEMKYQVFKSGFSLLPHFFLHDGAGTTIFVTIDQDPEWKDRLRSKGEYTSTVWIPGNLMNEGTVFVACIMRSVEQDIVHFNEDNAIAFEIIEKGPTNSTRGSYTKGIPGAVRPALKWTTEYKSL